MAQEEYPTLDFLECAEELGMYLEEFPENYEEQLDVDPILQNHLLCVAQKQGLVVVKDGQVDLDYFKTKVLEKFGLEELPTVERCLVQEGTLLDTFYKAFKCIKKNLKESEVA